MTLLAVLILALDRPALTLERAVQTAQAAQPALRQAEAARESAEDRAREARAPLFPQAQASATYQRTTGNRTLRAGTDPRVVAAQPAPSTQLYDYYRLEFSATQLVYDFGRTLGQASAAEATARAQAQAQRVSRRGVVLQVRLAFFAALAQLRLLEIARQTSDNERRHLAQVEGFVAARVRPDIDLAQARLDAANAAVQVVDAEGAYADARALLNASMGVEHDVDFDVEDAAMGPVDGEDASIDALSVEATANRPEIAGLRDQKSAAEAQVRSALGSYGPALSVAIAASDLGSQVDQMRWNYSGAVILSWPLFDGLATPSRVGEARANLRAVEAQGEGVRQALLLDVAQARIAVRSAKAASSLADRAVDSADERLRLAEGRYEAGVGDAIELGDAILARATAAAQRVRSRYALSAARAQLLWALGRD